MSDQPLVSEYTLERFRDSLTVLAESEPSESNVRWFILGYLMSAQNVQLVNVQENLVLAQMLFNTGILTSGGMTALSAAMAEVRDEDKSEVVA